MSSHILYNGKMVPLDHFRVVLYKPDGLKKRINNYQEYKEHLNNGWFENKKTAEESIKVKEEKPVKKRGRPPKKG